VAQLITGLRPERVRANLAAIGDEVRQAARRASRDPAAIEILAAVKYVPAAELGVLAQAGIRLVGENRVQELIAKQELHRADFEWDFIGQLQSRKVRQLVGRVRRIHSLASESALRELARHAAAGGTSPLEALLEVNVAGEAGKAGLPPSEIGSYLERSPVPIVGLMTMPPQTSDAEGSRRWFAALRELAEQHALPQLSMGTTQDFTVAVEEGATIVRIGSRLYG
jgi:pyridoxal phosphate enzyme (YggS family)